eukprot:11823725-Heterocapsa_arctica.AAC.1
MPSLSLPSSLPSLVRRSSWVARSLLRLDSMRSAKEAPLCVPRRVSPPAAFLVCAFSPFSPVLCTNSRSGAVPLDGEELRG